MISVQSIKQPCIDFETARKRVDEMSLINGFLFDNALEDEEDARIVIGKILEAIFGREFKNISIKSQTQLQGIDTDYHGIRLDAHITEDPKDNSLAATIYDIEMEDRASDKNYLPKRLRYYGGLSDSKHLETNALYDKLPDFVTITISSYDPFGAKDMFYEARSVLVTHPKIPYSDGIRHLFFYCNGKPNPEDVKDLITSPSHSKKLQEMLKYIVSGEKPDSLNQDIDQVETVVTKIKKRPEVTKAYMRQIDREYSIIRDTKEETKKDDALKMIRFAHEDGIPDSKTTSRLREFDLPEDIIQELFDQIRQEEQSIQAP